MSSPPKSLNEFAARLATFTTPHQLTKRRASSTVSKKKKGDTVEWPHEYPSGHALARAGFFYRPSLDSNDNVQCFMCSVKLDGWEATDDPISEHLAHSRGCAWATAISVIRDEGDLQKPESRDPLSEEMYAARTATFKSGDGWPHEAKKGWKCKISKMVDAGWALDPNDESEDRDGVTCFYCNLSLDGWEPKDDPFVEHKRREPACPYFALLEQYHGAEAAEGKMKSVKGRGKASARSSTASKASRMSTQSMMSEAPSVAGSLRDLELEGSLAGADDSIVTTATTASQASTAKGKKKAAKPKAAAKGAKGKKASVEEDIVEVEYPNIAESQLVEEEAEPPEPPTKATRRGGRASRQLDSSVLEISQMDIGPLKKATRTRKPKVTQPEPENENEPVPGTPDINAIAAQRKSEVAAQLQDELEHSMDEPALVEDTKPKRGVKRTSDGLRKEESSMVEEQENAKPAAKAKRGRKVKQTSTGSTDMDPDSQPAPSEESMQVDSSIAVPHEEAEEATKPKAKAAPKKAKAEPKAKKASTARSSRSSKVSNQVSEPELNFEEHEDLERDEREIEQELERIAAEESAHAAVQIEQDQADEYETSPSQNRVSKDSAELRQSEVEIFDENRPEAVYEDHAHPANSPPRLSLHLSQNKAFMTSPTGSDKENHPSSVMASAAKQPHPQPMMSPTKTSRIPLALGTPNRSPNKQFQSPSKQISHLASTNPWQPVDLDTVLLASPQPTPGRVGRQLVAAAGELTSPEKKMSVEEWVRFRAEQGEEQLRRRCELMVAAFEREGLRGLECLAGVEVVE